MGEAFLVGGVRTPVGRYGGALAGVRPDDLAALVVREAVTRAGVPDEAVDEVVLGAANQAGEDNRNVARMAVLLAGLPDAVPGFTVNRLCASGLQAVMSAAQAVAGGAADVVVAGGVESMTRAPWVMAKPGTPWARPGEVADTALGWRLVNPRMPALDGGRATITLGDTAEEVALLDGITREECDAYAVRSQERATRAQDKGSFDGELVAVPVPKGEPLTRDETSAARHHARGPGPAEAVVPGGRGGHRRQRLTPVGRRRAVVVASAEAVERFGLEPRARVVAGASAGVPPHLMGLGPVPATTKLLERTGLTVADLDAVELNEAFAAQVIACVHRLGLDEDTLNADGGAIALGHPLGSSGCRLLVTLLARLEREDGRRGLVTLCVGVGQGSSLLVERV